MTTRTWRLLVAGSFLLGLGVRIASVLGRPHLAPAGDPYQYWGQANLLAEGKGYIEPLQYAVFHKQVPTAKLPPLYTLLLTLCSLVGFKSFFAHRIWSAILNSFGVLTAAALGRRVAGLRVGALARGRGGALPEHLDECGHRHVGNHLTHHGHGRVAGRLPHAGVAGLAVVGVARVERRAGRAGPGRAAGPRDPSPGHRGLRATGGRPDVAVPTVPGRSRRGRHHCGVGPVGDVQHDPILAPGIHHRSPRRDPVLGQLARFLAWAVGGVLVDAVRLESVQGVRGDESAENSVATGVGLRYIEHHLGSWPTVEAERLGRTFAFWRVSQQIGLDGLVEGRPYPWDWVGLWSFYGLVALAPFGVIRLRRSGTWTFPLWAVLGDVVLVVLVTYGETRFRATLEPVLVLIGAVAVDGALGRSVLEGEDSHRLQRVRSHVSRAPGERRLSASDA